MQHPREFDLAHLNKLYELTCEPDDGLGRARYLRGEFERYYLNHTKDILESLDQAALQAPVAQAALAYYNSQGAYPERQALERAVTALLQAAPEAPPPELALPI